MKQRDLIFRLIHKESKKVSYLDLRKQEKFINLNDFYVDQYTQLNTKQGRKIFENDIIIYNFTRYYNLKNYECLNDAKDPRLITKTFISPVIWDYDCFITSENSDFDSPLASYNEICTVIGNLHFDFEKYKNKFTKEVLEYFKNENDFGGNNFKEVINRENKEKSEILDELIVEISRVRDLLIGVKKGPLRTNYLNKILDFYKELEINGFDYKDETK